MSTTKPECAMRHNIGTVKPSSSLTPMLDEGPNDNDSLAFDPFLLVPDPLVPDPPVPENVETKMSPAATSFHPISKKRLMSTQDIQRMQLGALTLERKKIELEVENMQLANKKSSLEIQDRLQRSEPVSLLVENNINKFDDFFQLCKMECQCCSPL